MQLEDQMVLEETLTVGGGEPIKKKEKVSGELGDHADDDELEIYVTTPGFSLKLVATSLDQAKEIKKVLFGTPVREGSMKVGRAHDSTVV
jgi:hypothetical protein